MSVELSSLIQKPGLKFRFFVGGEPVSRGEIEDMSMLPKPVFKGGATDRLWTIEPVEIAPDSSKPLVCLLKCDGVLVGQRDFLVWAFLDENDQAGIAKWVVSPGQDVDGQTKLNIALIDSPFAWRDPDHIPNDGSRPKQIPLTESFVPEYRFTLEPVFE
ncbi:hypothetical protein PHLGIDRAFT_19386 [Phlebiopsis gigantea 11061_1 CR5-6]|uniref:Uncharacterized protein n=1 Tax=Phlebiopsis gigantea (strain 11061_1 CR5-6) TaxID=745531 RepID=A0A0C3SA27_PHLG1|nr:hypothetical protein PHLGIDRAFT_19386 [Phlebiopsis gigantea 11061_1 CR5-6]